MKILSYELQYSQKQKFNWKKLKFIMVDTYRVIENYIYDEYCPYSCFSDEIAASRIVFESSNKLEAEQALTKWQINLSKKVV